MGIFHFPGMPAHSAAKEDKECEEFIRVNRQSYRQCLSLFFIADNLANIYHSRTIKLS